MAKEPEHSTDLLSPREIAALLYVQRNTVHMWVQRGHLPEPTRVVSGCPLWKRLEIARWALETGRLRGGPLAKELGMRGAAARA